MSLGVMNLIRQQDSTHPHDILIISQYQHYCHWYQQIITFIVSTSISIILINNTIVVDVVVTVGINTGTTTITTIIIIITTSTTTTTIITVIKIILIMTASVNFKASRHEEDI